MATRLSITIDQGVGKNDGETKRAELQNCVDMLRRIELILETTQAASGTVTDRNGAGTGHFTYTASALV